MWIQRDFVDAISHGPQVFEEGDQLYALKKQYGQKYKMKGVPRLVVILSAVPG